MPYLYAATFVAMLVLAHEVAWRRIARSGSAGPRSAAEGRRGGSIARKGLATLACAAGGYLYVAVLAFLLFTCRGVLTTRGTPTVDSVLEGFDASGKLEPGDEIVTVDGRSVGHTDEVVEAINAKAGAPVRFEIRRDGAPRTVEIAPRLDRRNDGSTSWVVGIRQHEAPIYDRDTGRAVGHALHYPIAQLHQGIEELGRSCSQPADPGGPKRIVDEYRTALDLSWLWLKLALRWTTYFVVVLAAADGLRMSRASLSRRRRRDGDPPAGSAA